MANGNKQLLYGPAAKQHFVEHFKSGLNEIQQIKKHLDIRTGRKVDKLRSKLARLVEQASVKVDSLVA